MFKIPCGGFELDEKSFAVNGTTLSTLPINWNDIPDKPFGEEVVFGEIFPEQELTLNRFGIYEQESIVPIEFGKEYAVTFGGVEYRCVAKNGATFDSTNEYLMDVIVLGSGNNFCENITDEPFVIAFAKTSDDASALGYGMHFSTNDYDTVPTLSIWGETATIKTIDTKYLPEAMQFGSEIDAGEITWDGDTTGLVPVLDAHYKVSDLVLSAESLIGQTLVLNLADGTEMVLNITSDVLSEREGGVTVNMDGATLALSAHTADEGVDIGTYFISKPGEGYVSSLTYRAETIKPLDPKYIVLTSPNGTKYNLSVADDGTLSATEAT